MDKGAARLTILTKQFQVTAVITNYPITKYCYNLESYKISGGPICVWGKLTGHEP